jgi:hypothetical protein
VVLTLLDWVIIGLTLAAVLNACNKGSGHETLHTFLLMAGLAAGALFLKDHLPAPHAADAAGVASYFLDFTFYTLLLYVVLWGALRLLVPVMLSAHIIGWRSRFWAGMQALAKILLLALGLNLAYAAASPLPSPQRLSLLPQVVGESALVNQLDVQTDWIYHGLARQGWFDDSKKAENGDISATTVGETSATVVAPTLDSVLAASPSEPAPAPAP